MKQAPTSPEALAEYRKAAVAQGIEFGALNGAARPWNLVWGSPKTGQGMSLVGCA